jgi:hypothetical protein
VKEQVVVTVVDTIKEVTTITVVLRQAQEPTEPEDTVRMTTVTDRTRASTRDRYHDVQEKLLVKTDTVYVERTSDSTALIAGLTRDPQKDTPARNSIRILRWICFILLALVALIIAARIFVFKR